MHAFDARHMHQRAVREKQGQDSKREKQQVVVTTLCSVKNEHHTYDMTGRKLTTPEIGKLGISASFYIR